MKGIFCTLMVVTIGGQDCIVKYFQIFPGRHAHVPGATHVPWSHSGLETEEINISCDIKIPLPYYITDVDLTQIGTETLIRSNSDSGTKHHRAGRNIICWCHLFCSKQYYSHALQLGLKCQWKRGLVLSAGWGIA